MLTEKNKNRFPENPVEILIRCLDRDDFTEWDEWRYHNEMRPISLSGSGLDKVNLKNADFSGVNLKVVVLNNVNLSGADLSEANLAGADLSHANLAGTDLWKADLKSANLWKTNLKNAQLKKANLANARLTGSNLQGADLWKANLKGTKFLSVVVDRRTFIWGCDFDADTVFSGKGLNNARIEPRLTEHMISHSRIS